MKHDTLGLIIELTRRMLRSGALGTNCFNNEAIRAVKKVKASSAVQTNDLHVLTEALPQHQFWRG